MFLVTVCTCFCSGGGCGIGGGGDIAWSLMLKRLISIWLNR